MTSEGTLLHDDGMNVLALNILIVGQGGREHALARAVRGSSSVKSVHVLPGNDGIAADGELSATCHQSVKPEDHPAILQIVREHSIQLVVIGPDQALAEGLSDFLRENKIAVFGPSKEGAKLEWSKKFAKEFLVSAEIPTAPYFVVDTVEKTLEKAKAFPPPWVLKADGLALGKGVFICQTLEELRLSAQSIFVNRSLGSAGNIALLEKFQAGFELSVHVLTNGKEFALFPFAQDHKRIGEGDTGPNTGGMGAVAPVPIDRKLKEKIITQILGPVMKELQKQKLDYRGLLYVGVMVSQGEPLVIEFNSRFGDPEAQVFLPLLESDWAKAFMEVALGRLPELRWKKEAAACVVLAAPNYPLHAEKDVEIKGDVFAHTAKSYFLHAGTKKDSQGIWRTNGGRVLNALGIGKDIQQALEAAYLQANKISWRGLQVRSDIGKRALESTKPIEN